MTWTADDAWCKRYRSYIRCGVEMWIRQHEARDLRGINWEFNAWGGTYDGLGRRTGTMTTL